ncbi:MAG TPA: prolyl oligopeptidase family serine peptidase [Candidatus Eisenbacteria bacterium]|nr:prolyl oligopeptidase family serine peptidase [Candidatus Eisenbacteria bacterium]
MRHALIRNARVGAAPVALFATLLACACVARAHASGYPPTRRDSVVDDLHGVQVADPYRWLERLDDDSTRDWVNAQTGVTEAYLARVPGRDAIRRRLETLWNVPRTDVPWREAGRLFYVASSGRQRQPVLYTVRNPGDRPRVVLDPHTISPDGSIEVGDYAVSPDGRWLSYSVSRGGADIGETHVRDLATGRDRDDVVHGAWGEACWTFDGGGFFYMRPPAAAPGDSSGAARAGKQLFYHVLGQPQSRDRLLRQWNDDVRWVYTMLSDDGRRAIVVAQRGENASMSVMDLGHARAPDLSAPLVPLLAGHDVGNTPIGTVGDVLYVVTHLDAPRGRVIALDLRQGAGARPRTVIPESDDVIQNATVAGDRLALQYLHDVCSRLSLFALDGRAVREVALPGVGAIGWPLNGRNSAPELWYAFTSYLTPATVYRCDIASGRSAAFHPAHVPFDPGAYETRQVFYRSKDGTRVPMFVTARRGIALDGSHPVLLTGYGGFGTVFAPPYRPDLPPWLEHGGVYAAANLRGGGEYGEPWHRAGSREHKQTSFDDFIAAAEYLVARGYTRPERLAIYGHSNGGLLIGAAITQRPDLFAAAVPNAGHYDMLRFHRFTVGAGWIPEYGSPDSAADFAVLRAYSPLHNVRAGTCYPATLLLAADHDDRVVPSHSYKFTAALQAAQACDAPVLLRVARNASHSYASDTEAIAEATDMWAFVAARVGVSLTSP